MGTTNFPATSLDDWADEADGDTIEETNINNVQEALEAVEAKVGIDSSAVATSHDYLLTHLPSQDQNWDAGAVKITAQTLESDVATGTAPLTIASTTVVSNLNADQVDGNDASAFVKKDGTVGLTANWDVGAYTVTALRFVSDQGTGTAPFTVASTTKVTNLNADQVDGKDAPTGSIVGTSDTQTLTNKTLTSPDINGGTADSLTSLTGANDLDIGAYKLTAQTLESDVTTGTAPLTVASTTVVSNLNADQLDGQEGSYYNDLGNASITSETQGDILYYSGSAWARLGYGTSGQFLKTQGSGNNPTWASVTTKSTLDSLDDVGALSESTGDMIYYDGSDYGKLVVDDSTVEISTGTLQVKDSGITNAKLANPATHYQLFKVADLDTGENEDYANCFPFERIGNYTENVWYSIGYNIPITVPDNVNNIYIKARMSNDPLSFRFTIDSSTSGESSHSDTFETVSLSNPSSGRQNISFEVQSNNNWFGGPTIEMYIAEIYTD